MSLGDGGRPVWLGAPEYIPLASHTLVLRTRQRVRGELKRSEANRSLLRQTLLPSFFFTGIGVLIMLNPDFDSSWTYKLAVLYYWALAVFVPWLVVRKEKKLIRRQLL
jgi:hypothetical protein